MTREEWLASSNAVPMLNYLTAAASDRKLRLFACACCRRVWDLLSNPARQAVEISERFADGLATEKELERGWSAAVRATVAAEQRLSHWDRITAVEAEAREAARERAWAAAHGAAVDAPPEERAALAELLRDIFSPFHRATADPSWLDSNVLQLAESIYEERTFDRMPQLGDALRQDRL